MKHEKHGIEEEKRNYFRIDDIICLSYRVVSWEEIRQSRERNSSFNKHGLTVKAQLNRLNRETQTIFRHIQPNSPNIAEYLELIDKKINILSDYIIDNREQNEAVDPQQVNISAGGLSFIAKKPVIVGLALELEMNLLPSNTGIFTYAKVVTCTEINGQPDGQYRIGVQFEYMDDDVRDIITRHVMDKERTNLEKN